MKHLVLAFSLLLAGGTAVVTTSCSSSSSDPEPAKATLSGQITPAGAVSEVTATAANGNTTTVSTTGTGAYAFPGLPVGIYTLSFAAAPGYTAPAPQQVTLAATGTTATPITATLAPASASFTAGGNLVTPSYIFSQTLGGSRRIMFTVSPGGAPGPTLSIYLDGMTPVVGTYPLDDTLFGYNASYLAADYLHYFTNGNNNGAPRSGTLTITSVGTTPRRFAGTFAFVGYGQTNAGAYISMPITNGTFTNVPY